MNIEELSYVARNFSRKNFQWEDGLRRRCESENFAFVLIFQNILTMLKSNLFMTWHIITGKFVYKIKFQRLLGDFFLVMLPKS